MVRFSIVVPLFNKAEFVVDTVNSILAQAIGDLEVIVVDDGSTDGGVQRLALITDPRLKILRQSNSGVSMARNVGISNARGMFVSFLDADDLWAVNHLSIVEDLINSDPKAIAWATGYTEFDQTQCLGEIMRRVPQINVASRRFDQNDFMSAWSRFPFFCTDSITVRASTLKAMQPCFPQGERLAEDQDLWFRLSELGAIRFFDVRDTVFYRRHVNDSLTTICVLEPLPAFVRLANRACRQSGNAKKAAHLLYGTHLLHVAWNNCKAGKRAVALRFLFQVRPDVRWTYWVRIFICLLLPVFFVRAGLLFARRFDRLLKSRFKAGS
ncbi:MAG: glycosyltransferase family 2 protein [Burkholderiales bacterium]|nr:glycosyltransferase family 2 protein [Burkholderiales bacterium]